MAHSTMYAPLTTPVLFRNGQRCSMQRKSLQAFVRQKLGPSSLGSEIDEVDGVC